VGLNGRTSRVVAVVVIVGMVLSLGLAGIASFYASSAPDGLERVAEDAGFAESAQDSAAADSPLAGYAAGDDEGRFSVGMAGLAGVGVTALVAFGLFAVLRPREDRAAQ
jgi:hypothetical protein